MKKNFLRDVVSSLTVVAMIVLFVFPAFEPGFVSAATSATAEVIVSQQVTGEMSIAVSNLTAGDVFMSPSIPGISGGVGTGTTTITVITNNAAGYTVALSALDNGKMMGNTTNGEILAYTPTASLTPEPWFVDINAAEFGYTIAADAADVVAGSIFEGLADGTNYTDASVPKDILKSATPTPPITGAVADLSFRAEITANPSPAIPEDLYVATTTLTMTLN